MMDDSVILVSAWTVQDRLEAVSCEKTDLRLSEQINTVGAKQKQVLVLDPRPPDLTGRKGVPQWE